MNFTFTCFRIFFLVLVLYHIKYTTSCDMKKSYSFQGNQIHIAALILARGGSKGIKLKNIAKINGHSLLAISLHEIFQVKQFDSVWVSTDANEIYNEALAFKDKVNIHWRSPESATDEATSIFAVQEFLKSKPWINIVALVQCTSPFIKYEYLSEAIQVLTQGRDCVFSVTKSYKLRWRRIDSERVTAINFDPAKRPRRQDWDGEFVENGMFYFARRKLLENGVFQTSNCALIEIPARNSLEIDSEYHLHLARHQQSFFGT